MKCWIIHGSGTLWPTRTLLLLVYLVGEQLAVYNLNIVLVNLILIIKLF